MEYWSGVKFWSGKSTFSLLINSWILWSGILEKSIALSLSDVVIFMLINVKMPTFCRHFNIYKQDKFRAQLS